MTAENAGEILAAWETSSQYWNKHQALIEQMYAPLSRTLIEEAKIGEVTAKISSSINMRNVLQTAVEELGRALPGSEVVIQFQTNQNKNKPTP